MRPLKRIALLIPVLLLFFLTNESGAAGGVQVNFTLLFGPAPETIADTQGKYMWVIPQIQNNSSEAESVTVSLEVTGPPEPDYFLGFGRFRIGCDQDVELILPGFDSFWMAPGEEKFVLYRVRYECHPPAYPEVFPLHIDFCVSGSFRSDCDSKTRYLIIHGPATESHSDGSGVSTAWFTLCPDFPTCLPPWGTDWYGFSDHWVGFLGGSPDAIYLKWFSHGIFIYEILDPDRPFDLYADWETTLSHMLCYGCGPIYDEEEMSQYTTTPGCDRITLPPHFCDSGDVGYTYIDPEFHGSASLWCVGLPGTTCMGFETIDYYYDY